MAKNNLKKDNNKLDEMDEWLCNDFETEKIINEVNKMSEEEKKAYIEIYEKENKNN